jgi:hypothetical protein
MKATVYFLACGAVVSIFAVGCKKDQAASATTTGATVTHDDAIMRLATARCDREQACNNIAPGKKYTDRDACTREATQNTRGTLRTDECPAIDEGKLSTCLNDIRSERCGNPLDTADRVASCRKGALCMSR